MAKVVALSSGGKDSVLALHIAYENNLKPELILTILPEDPESMLYHTHNLHHVQKIAESLGLEQITVKAEKDREEEALLETLKELRGGILVTGGIASRYQKDRFEKACQMTNFKPYSPLWGRSPESIFDMIFGREIKFIIVAVAAYGLGEEWLGKTIGREEARKILDLSIRYRFHPLGEGGDYDTFVIDAPLYKRGLEILEGSKEWFGDRGIYRIMSLQTVMK